ncbi:MAG: hypothetical protein RIT15_1441, partial [Pseudomonadota bacterium]
MSAGGTQDEAGDMVAGDEGDEV